MREIAVSGGTAHPALAAEIRAGRGVRCAASQASSAAAWPCRPVAAPDSANPSAMSPRINSARAAQTWKTSRPPVVVVSRTSCGDRHPVPRRRSPATAHHPAAVRHTQPGRRRPNCPRLGLADISADAELDIVLPGTALAEFYRLSIEALSQSLISAGLLTAAEAARLTARLAQPDFTGCGFAHIGAWGRRNDHPAA